MPFITHAFTITEEMEMFTNTIGECSLFTVLSFQYLCINVNPHVATIILYSNLYRKKKDFSFLSSHVYIRFCPFFHAHSLSFITHPHDRMR